MRDCQLLSKRRIATEPFFRFRILLFTKLLALQVGFMNRYLDPARQAIDEELLRTRNYLAWLANQQTAAMRQWRSIKQFLTSWRGAWYDE